MRKGHKRLSLTLSWGAADCIDELARRRGESKSEVMVDLLKKQIAELRESGVLKMPGR